MPTYERIDSFAKDFEALSPAQRKLFRAAVAKFVEDLKAARGVRNGLRVKGIQGMKGCYEMTFAPDGRAIFSYGPSVRDNEPHVIWVAIGTHNILP